MTVHSLFLTRGTESAMDCHNWNCAKRIRFPISFGQRQSLLPWAAACPSRHKNTSRKSAWHDVNSGEHLFAWRQSQNHARANRGGRFTYAGKVSGGDKRDKDWVFPVERPYHIKEHPMLRRPTPDSLILVAAVLAPIVLIGVLALALL